MGILKTAAKVAVASSVHGRIQRRQQARWAAQDQAAAAPAPPPAPVTAAPPAPGAVAPAQQAPAAPAPSADTGERLAQLTQLGELLKAGILTEDEFQQQKTRILNG
jgi:hypothetical protein